MAFNVTLVQSQNTSVIHLPQIGTVYSETNGELTKILTSDILKLEYQWWVLNEFDLTLFVAYDSSKYQLLRLKSDYNLNNYEGYPDSISIEPIDTIYLAKTYPYISLTYNTFYEVWLFTRETKVDSIKRWWFITESNKNKLR